MFNEPAQRAQIIRRRPKKAALSAPSTTLTNTMNNTNNVTAIVSNFTDSWGDLLKNNQRLDIEALLNSDLLAATRNDSKLVTCVFFVTGSISIVASTCLIVHILRSHDGLSTTYHRLILGLSIADIFSSLACALASTMSPKEMNYIKPFASGSMVTCSIQGFMADIGVYAAALYNCCVCFYYLAIIKYSKKDDYIRNKLEPWFHGISLIFPFLFGIASLASNAYFFDSYDGRFCYSDPGGFTAPPQPHCIGYETGETPEGFSVPCRHGGNKVNVTIGIIMTSMAVLVLVLIPPCVCIWTMLLMYRSVSKIEQRMQNYGVNTLRLDRPEGNSNNNSVLATETNSSHSDTDNNEETTMSKIKKLFTRMIPTFSRSSSRSNSRMTSSKRAIFQMAIGYVLAWGLIYIPGAILIALLKTSAPQETLYQLASIALAVLTPLQGFYNFLVFMSPKVRAIKGSRAGRSENLTWIQAFIIAYNSRGDTRRRSGGGSGGNSSSSPRKYHRSSSTDSVTPSMKQNVKKFLTKLTSSKKSVNSESDNGAHSTNHHISSISLDQGGVFATIDNENLP